MSIETVEVLWTQITLCVSLGREDAECTQEL